MKQRTRLKILMFTAGLATVSGCNYATKFEAIERTRAESTVPQRDREKELEEAVSATEENRGKIAKDLEIRDPNDPNRSEIPPPAPGPSEPPTSSAPGGTPASGKPDPIKEKEKDVEWSIENFADEYALPLPEKPLEIGDYKTEIAVPFKPREEETPTYTFEPAEFIRADHVDREELKES